MQDRRFAPSETIAESEIDRPISTQLRPSFDFNDRARLGLAVNTCGKWVCALALDPPIDRHRAVNAFAASIERDGSRSFNEAPDIAIGVDPEDEYPSMHATDPLIYCREPTRNVLLNLGGKGRQAKLNRRGDSG